MDKNTSSIQALWHKAKRYTILVCAGLLFGLLLSACAPATGTPNTPDDTTSDEPKVFTPQNVIMISVQDLGDGLIGGNYYDTPLTPGLNALLSDFSYYQNNVSASPYASGLDVVMSSSVYAPQYSAALVGLRGEDVNTLGKILSEKGFYTLAVTSGPKGAYGGSKTYKSFGYDHFITVSVDDLPQKSVYSPISFFIPVTAVVSCRSKGAPVPVMTMMVLS